MNLLRISCSAFLSRFTSLFVILMGAAAFAWPGLFSWVHGDAQTVVLGIIMLAMGMTLSKKDFAVLGLMPGVAVIGLGCIVGGWLDKRLHHEA